MAQLGRATDMESEMDLQKICEAVEKEWQSGGLSDGIYGDYAKEVARRAVAAEREACMNLCLSEKRNPFSRDHNNGLQHAADAIRARSNAI
jgi:hypothetical protein